MKNTFSVVASVVAARPQVRRK